MVTDVAAEAKGSAPTRLTGNGTVTYFTADDREHGQELWASDGTTAGTRLVKDVNPGRSGSAPTWLTLQGPTLYFIANDGTHGAELWKSDGTSDGTTLVADIVAGAAGTSRREPRRRRREAVLHRR